MEVSSSTTPTAAQEEFNGLFNKKLSLDRHPEDEREDREESDEQTEEDQYLAQQIDETMRMPVFDRAGGYHLPHSSFDLGRTTGVKGVIADARSFDQAKKQAGWKSSSNTIGGGGPVGSTPIVQKKDTSDDENSSEDEEFLERWREERKMQLLREGSDIRNRRTSPSMRRFGRFDEVDAMGYLDAIEKVGRETVVCVFVYDHECAVSQVIEEALIPLVAAYPSVHFVKVHYEEIEFDNAGVPAILAYKNQGELFANLTYIIDQIPDDTLFDTEALKAVFNKHNVL